MKKRVLILAGSLLFTAAFNLQLAVAQNSTAPGSSGATAPATKPHTASTAKSTAHSTKKGSTASAAKTGARVTLSTPKDKTSYALGINMGKGLQRNAVDVDPNLVLLGLKDGLAGNKGLLSDEEIQATLMQLQVQFQAKMQERMKEEQEKRKAMGAGARKEGEAFLAANKSKEGVVTLPSGLQYKVLTQGNGPKPTANDTVSCNYRGTFINGTEFDSSAKHGGQPVSFPVGRVIRGWTEALQLMPVGSKWQLFIPADMAYGDNSPPDIPPGSTLIFDVELVSIEGKK